MPAALGCATGAQEQRSGGGLSTASGAVIPAPVGGSDEPYPIPWLDKNGSHNQAGDGLDPSSIYHFKGRIARAAEFVGSGVAQPLSHSAANPGRLLANSNLPVA